MDKCQWEGRIIDYSKVIEGVFMFCSECGKELE